jgi:endonuclease/exonuclease/phosphatase family metal-dependent hydrolase
VHLKAGKFCEKGRQRKAEIAESLSILDIVKRSENLILMGDFNFRDDENEIHPNLEDNFKDVWKTLYKDDPGYTHNPTTNSMAREQAFR